MTLPSIEAILIEIHQSLGGPPYQTKKKTKFVTGKASLRSHIEMGREVLRTIFDVLGMDDDARSSAEIALFRFGGVYKDLELKTLTFDADQRQVLWMLLGWFYVPGLARHAAFWTLASRMDQHMPVGRFWYLPELREIHGKLSVHLPVAQVLDWLLDLLGMSLEEFADERSLATDGDHDGLRRTLYNWCKDKVPDLSTIEKYFPDAHTIEFKGAFFPDKTLSPPEHFGAALVFVKRKQLTAARLREEIPMTAAGRLESVFDGSASDEEKATFVRLLSERYAAPSARTIRQYLRFARMVQDGYIRLLRALFPGVEPLCSDPRQNKLLQVFELYKLIYNLSVEAWDRNRDLGEGVENAWFEAKLPPWYACGPLLSILPSQQESSIPRLAYIMSRHFEGAHSGADLEDHFGTDDDSRLRIIAGNSFRWNAAIDELAAADELTERLKSGAPWQKLQGEHRFRVVRQIAPRTDMSDRIRQATIARLHELAETPSEVVQGILVELGHELNGYRKHRTKETQGRVQALLGKAEASLAYELWKAPILQYKAKHRLALNDFEGAIELFREALTVCDKRSYGSLRGEIAHDCFAVELADQRLIQNNHEIYYRGMVNGGIFESEEPPGIEDAARIVFQYFWNTLYQPYSGLEARRPRSEAADKSIAETWADLALQNDQSGLVDWITGNRMLLQSPLRDVEGNSVLMLLIKYRTQLMHLRQSARRAAPRGLNASEALEPSETYFQRWRQGLRLLVKHGPAEQLNIPDFKGQTPLMLMAEAGDAELVACLLEAGAEPGKHDYKGRTALTAAIKSRVSACVDALLDHPWGTNSRTSDERSVLHTAVWTGNLHAAKRLVLLAPELAWKRDLHGMTPLELAEHLVADPQAMQALADEGHRVGQVCATRRELEDIASILEKAPVPGRA